MPSSSVAQLKHKKKQNGTKITQPPKENNKGGSRRTPGNAELCKKRTFTEEQNGEKHFTQERLFSD